MLLDRARKPLSYSFTRAVHITIAQQLVSTLACLHRFVCVPNLVGAGTAVWAQPDAYQMPAVLEDGNSGSPGMSSVAVHYGHQTAMERSWCWEGMKWDRVVTHENARVKPITSCANSVKLSRLLSQITYWIWVSKTQITGCLGVTQRSPYS